MEGKVRATEEQKAYATLLDYGMKAGLLMLLVSFAVYMSGILPTHLPVERLPEYWTHPVHGSEGNPGYLELAGIQPGWWWLSQLGKGDFLNFVGIAFLAAVTIFTYLRIVPILLRKGDRVYAALALLEVLVLVLAASGILKAGGH